MPHASRIRGLLRVGVLGWLHPGAFVILLVSFSACSDEVLPSTPTSTVRPPTSPATPVPNTTSASLRIEHLSALAYPNGVGFTYDVRFQLRETGGNSGAT